MKEVLSKDGIPCLLQVRTQARNSHFAEEVCLLIILVQLLILRIESIFVRLRKNLIFNQLKNVCHLLHFGTHHRLDKKKGDGIIIIIFISIANISNNIKFHLKI